MNSRRMRPAGLAPGKGLQSNARTFGADFNTASLPPRPWVLGRRFLTGEVTLNTCDPILWPAFAVLTGLAIATGKPLFKQDVHTPGPVAFIGHDRNEWREHIYAACRFYRIPESAIRNRVFFIRDSHTDFIPKCHKRGIVWASFASPYHLDKVAPVAGKNGTQLIGTARDLARDAAISLELNLCPEDIDSGALAAAAIATSTDGDYSTVPPELIGLSCPSFLFSVEKNRYDKPRATETRFHFRPVKLQSGKKGVPDHVVDVPVIEGGYL